MHVKFPSVYSNETGEVRNICYCVSDLRREYNLLKSMISTILMNKDKLVRVNAATVVSRISSQRPQIMDDVERLLLIWINETNAR